MRRALFSLWVASGISCGGAASAAVPEVADLAPAWATVQAGAFEMGARRSEFCRREPAGTHSVSLESAFEVGTAEVTQREFEGRMGYNPSFASRCDTCPVDSVSWHEAAAYAVTLAEGAGETSCYACEGEFEDVRCKRSRPCDGPRLPTEAEWEYVARAGTEQSTYAGRITSCMSSDEVADQVAWYKANSRGQPRAVRRKVPNAWGLYDVLGNVAEWTDGFDSGGLGVLRGGSWYHNAERSRSAGRLLAPATRSLSYAGFRLVRPLSKPAAAAASAEE